MNINQYAVYQLKESAELAAYRSRSYQYLTEHHFQVIVQNYQQAYFTKLFTSDTPEMIRKRLEEHRPKNFRGRPFGVGDVIVINQQGEITAYFVDKDSLVVVAGFIRSSSSGILVTLDTKNLFIDGCAGTWMATEECVVESQHFFLMQHEVYKEKAPNVIVDASGKLVSTEIRKGLDEDARKKILDYLHNLYQNLCLKSDQKCTSLALDADSYIFPDFLSRESYTFQITGFENLQTKLRRKKSLKRHSEQTAYESEMLFPLDSCHQQ